MRNLKPNLKPQTLNLAIVIGAGPAGLATSRELARRGVEHVVLERGRDVGHSWANLYDSLTLHTGKHMSALPGLKLPRTAPLFVPRPAFLEYLRDYARRFDLPVQVGWDVQRITPASSGAAGWRVEGSSNGSATSLEAETIVVATGIIANPRVPQVEGRAEFERAGGRVFHSIEYRRPDDLLGKRVVVVGVGNSGGEIASEIARTSAAAGKNTRVTVAVRSGANVVPRDLFGIPIQYLAYYLRKLPRAAREAVVGAIGRVIERRQGPPVLPRPPYGPLDAIPLIGFHLTNAIREGLVDVRGEVERLTSRGVLFADARSPREEPFDVVILATGFTAALQPLGELVRVDAKGFAVRSDRVTSADHPGLYFVGHNYDSTGGLFNIARDSVLAADAIAARQ